MKSVCCTTDKRALGDWDVYLCSSFMLCSYSLSGTAYELWIPPFQPNNSQINSVIKKTIYLSVRCYVFIFWSLCNIMLILFILDFVKKASFKPTPKTGYSAPHQDRCKSSSCARPVFLLHTCRAGQ